MDDQGEGDAASLGAQPCALYTRWRMAQRSHREQTQAFYAPVEDGCSAVVHAATMDWAKDKRSVRPEEDLRFYARGMFASPLVTWAPSGGGRGLSRAFWSLAFLIASLCDYPMRFFTGEGRRQCT